MTSSKETCIEVNIIKFKNLGRRLGTSKMHLSPPPPAVRSKAVVLLLLTFCLLWESVIVLCFVVC